MTTKKISKIIVYYEDGTYEEVKAGVSDIQNKEHQAPAAPSPVKPDFRPDTRKVKEYEYEPTGPFYPQVPQVPWPNPAPGTWPGKPYEVWCFSDDKYSITSTSNGNVDL